MSRDFLLVLGGGVVSLVTTLVVLFISDVVYRRDMARLEKRHAPPETLPRPSGAEEAKT